MPKHYLKFIFITFFCGSAFANPLNSTINVDDLELYHFDQNIQPLGKISLESASITSSGQTLTFNNLTATTPQIYDSYTSITARSGVYNVVDKLLSLGTNMWQCILGCYGYANLNAANLKLSSDKAAISHDNILYSGNVKLTLNTMHLSADTLALTLVQNQFTQFSAYGTPIVINDATFLEATAKVITYLRGDNLIQLEGEPVTVIYLNRVLSGNKVEYDLLNKKIVMKEGATTSFPMPRSSTTQ